MAGSYLVQPQIIQCHYGTFWQETWRRHSDFHLPYSKYSSTLEAGKMN